MKFIPTFITDIFTDLFDVFRAPTAGQIVKRQLNEVHREILRHQDAAEYSDAMVIYLQTKMQRLQQYGLVADNNISGKAPVKATNRLRAAS